MLRERRLPFPWRLRFLVRKYPALVGVLSGRQSYVRFNGFSLLIRDLGGLGTLQSTILDVCETFGQADILGRPDPLIIDVGANIGQFTNAVKLLYPMARVIAFEPDPEVFEDLRTNTASLDLVELHNVALGAQSTVLPFHRHVVSGASTFREIADPVFLRSTLDVAVERMDDIVAEDISPDLVKIDVEGYELETVRGAIETSRRARFLLLELSLGRPSGANNLRVIRVIADILPAARVVRFGRPLGDPSRPDCQDVLIALNPAENRRHSD
jgi:FkbM family methyltransferase